MAVSRNGASAPQVFTNQGTTASFSYTVSDSAGYVRLAGGWEDITNPSDPTLAATYAGAAMTVVGIQGVTGDAGRTAKAVILEKITPATGAQTVALTFSSSPNYGTFTVSDYANANQSVASGTPVTNSGTASTVASATLTVTAGNMASDAAFRLIATTYTGNKTEIGKGAAFVGNAYWGACQDSQDSGSVTFTWTPGVAENSNWAILVSEILVASAGGGAPAARLTLLGVGA